MTLEVRRDGRMFWRFAGVPSSSFDLTGPRPTTAAELRKQAVKLLVEAKDADLNSAADFYAAAMAAIAAASSPVLVVPPREVEFGPSLFDRGEFYRSWRMRQIYGDYSWRMRQIYGDYMAAHGITTNVTLLPDEAANLPLDQAEAIADSWQGPRYRPRRSFTSRNDPAPVIVHPAPGEAATLAAKAADFAQGASLLAQLLDLGVAPTRKARTIVDFGKDVTLLRFQPLFARGSSLLDGVETYLGRSGVPASLFGLPVVADAPAANPPPSSPSFPGTLFERTAAIQALMLARIVASLRVDEAALAISRLDWHTGPVTDLPSALPTSRPAPHRVAPDGVPVDEIVPAQEPAVPTHEVEPQALAGQVVHVVPAGFSPRYCVIVRVDASPVQGAYEVAAWTYQGSCPRVALGDRVELRRAEGGGWRVHRMLHEAMRTAVVVRDHGTTAWVCRTDNDLMLFVNKDPALALAEGALEVIVPDGTGWRISGEATAVPTMLPSSAPAGQDQVVAGGDADLVGVAAVLTTPCEPERVGVVVEHAPAESNAVWAAIEGTAMTVRLPYTGTRPAVGSKVALRMEMTTEGTTTWSIEGPAMAKAKQADVDELRTWTMDIRQLLSDNAIKDMLAEKAAVAGPRFGRVIDAGSTAATVWFDEVDEEVTGLGAVVGYGALRSVAVGDRVVAVRRPTGRLELIAHEASYDAMVAIFQVAPPTTHSPDPAPSTLTEPNLAKAVARAVAPVRAELEAKRAREAAVFERRINELRDRLARETARGVSAAADAHKVGQGEGRQAASRLARALATRLLAAYPEWTERRRSRILARALADAAVAVRVGKALRRRERKGAPRTTPAGAVRARALDFTDDPLPE
jgi:hypothetical protein